MSDAQSSRPASCGMTVLAPLAAISVGAGRWHRRSLAPTTPAQRLRICDRSYASIVAQLTTPTTPAQRLRICDTVSQPADGPPGRDPGRDQ